MNPFDLPLQKTHHVVMVFISITLYNPNSLRLCIFFAPLRDLRCLTFGSRRVCAQARLLRQMREANYLLKVERITCLALYTGNRFYIAFFPIEFVNPYHAILPVAPEDNNVAFVNSNIALPRGAVWIS